MNKILPIILAVVLSGCSQPMHYTHHIILGTHPYVTMGYVTGGTSTYQDKTKGVGWLFESVHILLDAEVNGLRMRHVRLKTKDGVCKSGYLDVIELDGFIGSDSTVMVKRMIDRLEPCFNDDDEKVPNVVYLNSYGGYLFDGYAMGRLFREKGIKTIIASNQVCASSCATAFIGGKYRAMGYSGKLIFHSPYNKTGIGINCDDKGHTSGLKGYYNEILPKDDSELLLKRTLSYCSVDNGGGLNDKAAILYNIVNDKPLYDEIHGNE